MTLLGGRTITFTLQPWAIVRDRPVAVWPLYSAGWGGDPVISGSWAGPDGEPLTSIGRGWLVFHGRLRTETKLDFLKFTVHH